jgi:homoserine dehydrogenase
MIRAGLSFEDALAEAQQKGYAERDPSADILGHDACRKICILSAIAFGRHIYPNQVPTEGITGITLADVDYAASVGKKIKLLGRAVRQQDGKICACVEPHLVDDSNPLAGVEDVFNAIAVRGDAVGDVMFYGRGAGKLPTASAVAADVIDIAAHQGHRRVVSWAEGGDDTVSSTELLKSFWYVRAVAGENALQTAFGNVKMLSSGNGGAGECACLTTCEMSRGEIDSKLAGLDVRSVIRVLD